jgi:uncharacterized membrane protein
MIGTSGIFLVAASFLASSVEMVEALTIVLAVGVTRGWRSTFTGVALALVALAVVVAVLGPALTIIPLPVLRLVVGALLLIFGLQWLRKAILRASGYKSLHDEEAIYRRNLEESRRAATVVRAGMDWYAFTLSFKGVFLEGLEVAFIVLTFGSTAGPGGIVLAAEGAVVAIVLVGLAGVLVHQPLSTVPENTLKFAVGAMLTTFGIFWGAEGAAGGVNPDVWPAGDAAILGILALVLIWSLVLVNVLRRQHERIAAPVGG